MKKWGVDINLVIRAGTREQAWRIAEEMIEGKFRGLANVKAVALEPLPDPEHWIAVNEPIRARR